MAAMMESSDDDTDAETTNAAAKVTSAAGKPTGAAAKPTDSQAAGLQATEQTRLLTSDPQHRTEQQRQQKQQTDTRFLKTRESASPGSKLDSLINQLNLLSKNINENIKTDFYRTS